MEKLELYNRYLIQSIQLDDIKTEYGLQEIYVAQISKKAIKIKFIISGQVRWLYKTNKINIVENIT